MLDQIMLAISGAALNRIRGSGKFPIGSNEEYYEDSAPLFYIPAKPWQPILMGGFAYCMGTEPQWAALLTASCWLGQSPGWGRYIGASQGNETQLLHEWPTIDWTIKWARPWPKLWGHLGLTLRGLAWGLTLSWFNPHTLWMGLAFPLSYSVAYFLCKEFETHNPPGDAWELGEFFAGAALWSLVFWGQV